MIYLECREQKYATITIVLYGLCSEHFLKKGLFLFFFFSISPNHTISDILSWLWILCRKSTYNGPLTVSVRHHTMSIKSEFTKGCPCTLYTKQNSVCFMSLYLLASALHSSLSLIDKNLIAKFTGFFKLLTYLSV